MKKKVIQILFLIASLTIAGWLVISAVRQSNAKSIFVQIAAATERFQNSPQDDQRVKKYFKRLDEVDAGYAPKEVKQAMQEYILASELAIGAYTDGRDNKQYDDAIETAKQKLDEAYNAHKGIKDPMSLFMALLATGNGITWTFFPQFFDRTITSEQSDKKRKKIKKLGFVMLSLGLMLLAFWILN